MQSDSTTQSPASGAASPDCGDLPSTPVRRRRAFSVYVDDDVCDGCGVCIFLCKPLVLAQGRKVNRRGAWPVTVLDAGRCTGCMLCEYACPQLAICAQEVGHDR